MDALLESVPKAVHNAGFDEDQWMKLLFLISDTQNWLNETQKGLLYQLPIEGKKKFCRKSYYLSATALAHILERHYIKIPRHPHTSKFTVPVIEIMSLIRDCFAQPSIPISGSNFVQRIGEAGKEIGIDQSGRPTKILTVVSDSGGRILTAFPGTLEKKISS
jgi:hypothetical protein